MPCGVPGGYTAVRYGATVATGVIQSSVSITGLLNGTNWGPTETDTIADAAGKQISTGKRISAQVITSLVSGSVITGLITHESACTDLYFRFVGIDGTAPYIGPVRVMVDIGGSEPSDVHRSTITLSGYDAVATDLINYP